MNNKINTIVANGLMVNQAELVKSLVIAFEANPQLMEFLADPSEPEYSIEKAQAYLDRSWKEKNRKVTSYKVRLRNDMTWEAEINFSYEAWFRDQEDADSHSSYRSSMKEDEEHPVKGTVESYVTTCLCK